MRSKSDFLKRMRREKIEEIEALKEKYPPSYVRHLLAQRGKFYSFRHALSHGARISVIAEVKYHSPSRGKIANFEERKPVDVALEYQGAGADAVSVLTDRKYFHGGFDYLSQIRDFVELPLLCKDFILDPYQIKLARAMGADAVLLIAAMLDDKELKELYSVAEDLHCDVLVEVHSQMELERVMSLIDPVIIGINSRDLRSLKVDISAFSRLIPQIPEEKIKVAESGITEEVIPMLSQLRVDAMLVGEYFMRQENIYYSLRRFVERLGY